MKPKVLQTYTSSDFPNQKLEKDEFENTEFLNCTFSDISKISFVNCLFNNCNLSNCKTSACKLQNVIFVNCKLLGVNFFQVKDFAFETHFENCLLDYASFDSKKMNQSSFKNCKMHEVNFTKSDLTKTTFNDCDLFEAVFSETNMTGLDLTKIHNFYIDPEINKIKGAKFRFQDLERLLYKYQIQIEP